MILPHGMTCTADAMLRAPFIDLARKTFRHKFRPEIEESNSGRGRIRPNVIPERRIILHRAESVSSP